MTIHVQVDGNQFKSVGNADLTAGSGVGAIAPLVFDTVASQFNYIVSPRQGDGSGGRRILSVTPFLYQDGSGLYDRERNNTESVLLASAVRTGTTSSADQTNYNGRGVLVHFNITAVPGGDTVTLTIEGRDIFGGSYFTYLAGAALATTGLRTYMVYPGVAAAAAGITGAVGFVVGRTWRITVTHSAATNFTYSVFGVTMR